MLGYLDFAELFVTTSFNPFLRRNIGCDCLSASGERGTMAARFKTLKMAPSLALVLSGHAENEKCSGSGYCRIHCIENKTRK
jgi:hypothetical protein